MTNTPQTPTIERIAEIEERFINPFSQYTNESDSDLSLGDARYLCRTVRRLQSELTEARAFTDVLTRAQDELTTKLYEAEQKINELEGKLSS